MKYISSQIPSSYFWTTEEKGRPRTAQLRMENVKETIEGTLEDVNEAIVEIANDFNDFAGEFSFSDLLDVGKTVGETLEMVGTKLNGMKEAEMEEVWNLWELLPAEQNRRPPVPSYATHHRAGDDADRDADADVHADDRSSIGTDALH